MQIEFLEDLSELRKLKNIPNLKKLIFELYSEKFDISQLPTQIEELSVQAYHLNLTPLTNFKNLKKLSIILYTSSFSNNIIVTIKNK